MGKISLGKILKSGGKNRNVDGLSGDEHLAYGSDEIYEAPSFGYDRTRFL
jgi:hypothetical protein